MHTLIDEHLDIFHFFNDLFRLDVFFVGLGFSNQEVPNEKNSIDERAASSGRLC